MKAKRTEPTYTFCRLLRFRGKSAKLLGSSPIVHMLMGDKSLVCNSRRGANSLEVFEATLTEVRAAKAPVRLCRRCFPRG